MSVSEIEAAIAKLAPEETRRVAHWILQHQPQQPAGRPSLAGADFISAVCSPDAFAPLDEKELAEFGAS